MRKVIYIILVIAVIGSGIYAWFYFSKNGSEVNSVTPSSSLPPSSLSSSSLPASYSITDTFPKTDAISIGTDSGSVEVKNFYKTIVDTEEGFVILVDNADYQTSYDRNASVFYIHFRNASAQQSKAETELLEMLGVSQQDACKLNVLIFQTGQNKGSGLSFCTQ